MIKFYPPPRHVQDLVEVLNRIKCKGLGTGACSCILMQALNLLGM